MLFILISLGVSTSDLLLFFLLLLLRLRLCFFSELLLGFSPSNVWFFSLFGGKFSVRKLALAWRIPDLSKKLFFLFFFFFVSIFHNTDRGLCCWNLSEGVSSWRRWDLETFLANWENGNWRLSCKWKEELFVVVKPSKSNFPLQVASVSMLGGGHTLLANLFYNIAGVGYKFSKCTQWVSVTNHGKIEISRKCKVQCDIYDL